MWRGVRTDTTLHSDGGPCPADGLIVASNVALDLNGYRVFAANARGNHASIRLGMFNPAAPTSPTVVTGVVVKNGTVEGFDAVW